MIEATRALRVWLEANGIDPRKVQLTLSADPTTAESIGRAVSDIIETAKEGFLHPSMRLEQSWAP